MGIKYFFVDESLRILTGLEIQLTSNDVEVFIRFIPKQFEIVFINVVEFSDQDRTNFSEGFDRSRK